VPEKRRLFFLIPNLGKGGAERILAHLLNHLDRNKFTLGCIFYNDLHAHRIPDDVTVLNLKLPGTRNPLKKIARYVSRIVKIIRIINEYKPDCFMSFMMNTPAILAAKLSSVKPFCIISSHSTSNYEERGIKYLFAKALYPLANHTVAVSRGLKSWLESKLNIHPSKISVIYNPIDLSAINKSVKEPIDDVSFFKENVPVITSAGRLMPEKGHKYLIKAFALCCRKINSRLVILGEGPEESSLKRFAHSLGIHDKVIFLGFQNNPFKFFANSTLFVLPSKFEGFGNVIVEAMACGTPVISSDCPVGPREIIQNGHNGILVPPRNPEALAVAMMKLLADDKERERLSTNACNGIEKYDVSRIVAQYEKIFSM
jgi:glycosyltransferase involved in cell wall biosynthesis